MRLPSRQEQFDIYAKWTDSVAKYPPTAEPFYLALGIADEMGEAVGALTNDNVIAEMGDVCWYIARYVTRVLNVRFSSAIAEAQRMCPEGSLPFHIGIICGVEKKRIRDGDTWSEEKKREKQAAAYESICQLMRWILWKCSRVNVTLENVLALNIRKLTARLDAGTIQGDGDKR
jgi:hypothetical protein